MGERNETEDSISAMRFKVKAAKMIFASGIGAVALLAGFKYGFSRRKSASSIKLDPSLEDPIVFARRALKRATFLTVGSFAAGVLGICLLFGIRSPDDLKAIMSKNFEKRHRNSTDEQRNKTFGDYFSTVINDKQISEKNEIESCEVSFEEVLKYKSEEIVLEK